MKVRLFDISEKFPMESGIFTVQKNLMLGLMELDVEVQLTKNPCKADIVNLVYPALFSLKELRKCRRIKLLYTVVEGKPLEPIPVKYERLVAHSRYACTMFGDLCDGYVQLGVAPERKRGRLGDIAVVFSYQTIEEGYIHKGKDLYEAFFARYKFKTVCSRVAPFSFCDVKVDKPWLYADVLLFLSRVEGFGLPVMEAMSSGTLPVYLDAPAVNEFADGISIHAKYRRTLISKAVRQAMPLYEPESDVAIYTAVKYGLALARSGWSTDKWRSHRQMAKELLEYL